MKHLKYLLSLVITLLLVSNINVFAATNGVKINVPKTISKDQEFSLDIVLSTDTVTDGFKATLTYETSVMELLNIEDKNNWHRDSEFSKESPLSLDFTHENGLTGDITITTLKFKVKSNVSKADTTITLEGTSKAKEEETITAFEKVSQNIAVKSTDNTLKDIKISGKSLTNFSPNQYEYEKDVDASTTNVNIEPVLNDKTATFKDKFGVRNNAPLDYGANKFEIIVISAIGEEKKYIVTLNRPDNRGTNNSLSDLIVNSNNKLLPFNSTELKYKITTHKLTTIDVEAIPQDPKATVKIDKPKELAVGINTITITVTSEKNESKVYTIEVNNLDTDIDTTLKDIEVFGIDDDIQFEKNKYDYEVMYKAKYKDNIVIKPELNNEDEAVVDKAKLDKDVANIGPGKKVTISVKAKDGTEGVESVYTITFKKDTRINFFLILGIIIFIVLLVIFLRLLFKNKKEKKIIEEKEKDLGKTKRLEKINLE